ncbi:MAG: hypothetical protein Q4G25_12720 [Paracoccus sp. (in: a-proteobacteria)]|nr:hypothetical protein [Paracoccus sp. (in: a-proteobacteria)]
MAYVLNDMDGTLDGVTLLFAGLGRYQSILEPDSEYDLDEALEERSAFEMVRDQLTPDQRAELDIVDAFWRANPDQFNAAFGVQHYQANKKTALSGYVSDAEGRVPAVPAAHWWWWPIPEVQQ